MKKEAHADLFEHYEKQPKELRKITSKYEKMYVSGDMDYKDTARFHKEVEAIGYTFDSGLDNEPYGLRKIGVELNELDGWEEFKNGGNTILNKVSMAYGSAKNSTKQSIKNQKKKIALNVIDDTKDKVSSNKSKMALKAAENIVDEKYAKGSTINGKKKTDLTISEYIKIEQQKLREHNANAHEDDILYWSDWKSELTSKDTREYGILYNSRMLDSNGDRGVFEYLPENKNYTEDEYAKGGNTNTYNYEIGGL
jgi:hypothetical protein